METYMKMKNYEETRTELKRMLRKKVYSMTQHSDEFQSQFLWRHYMSLRIHKLRKITIRWLFF